MEGHRFRDHSVWVWVAASLLLALLVTGIVGAKPAWLWVKQRRAQGFLDRYVQQQKSGHADAAGAELRSAFFLAPHYEPVRRAVAQFYTRKRSQDGLNLWRDLEAEGRLTAQDRLAYATLAVALERFDLASRLLQESLQTAPDDPAVLALASELAQRQGNLAAALQFADRALTREPANATNAWRLANLELRSPAEDLRRNGKQRLMAMVGASGRERLAAINLLLTSRQLKVADIDLLLRLLPDKPDAVLEERLARLELLNQRDPANRSRRVREFAAPFWQKENLRPLVAAAALLGSLVAFEDVLELVPEDYAFRDDRLFRFRAGALAELGRWPEVEALLTREGAPAQPLMKAVLQALTSHVSGRTNESTAHWQQALTLAHNDPGMIKAIARLAETRGYISVAQEAWRGLLPDPRTAPRAAAEMLRLAVLTHDLTARRDALYRLEQLGLLRAEQRPDLAFADLLLLGDAARARRLLAERSSGPTNTDLVAVTAALLALSENQPEQAALELEKLTLDWTAAPESWRAVRIAELGANGRRPEARKLAATLDRAVLKPAERKLVEPWMSLTTQ